jgi:hypothetical protein
MELIDRVKGYIDNQYGKPKGLIGTYIGEKMDCNINLKHYGLLDY